MELYIQIKDGQPFEHPILGSNFREAFPTIDVNNLPPTFAKFQRILQPEIRAFEVVEGPVYEWVNGVVMDVWTIRPMTATEELQKRKELVDTINATVEFAKISAQQNANSAPNLKAKQAWLDYIAELNTWVINDLVNPKMPRPPIILPDGTVMSTSSPGSTPNVIG